MIRLALLATLATGCAPAVAPVPWLPVVLVLLFILLHRHESIPS
jgi:hypothetical protein